MARIRICFENGSPERVIEFNPADAPFQRAGEPGSILDVLLGHGVRLYHACRGTGACATCVVIVTSGLGMLSDPSEDEQDILENLPGLAVTSRLGCQAVVADPQAEITLLVPA